MPTTLDIRELPEEVASLLSEESTPLFLEQDGRQIGVVVSPELYKRWEQRGDRLFAVIHEVSELNRDKTEEVEADIEAAIAEVRAARRTG